MQDVFITGMKVSFSLWGWGGCISLISLIIWFCTGLEQLILILLHVSATDFAQQNSGFLQRLSQSSLLETLSTFLSPPPPLRSTPTRDVREAGSRSDCGWEHPGGHLSCKISPTGPNTSFRLHPFLGLFHSMQMNMNWEKCQTGNELAIQKKFGWMRGMHYKRSIKFFWFLLMLLLVCPNALLIINCTWAM